jgi:hypothetical protein
MPTAVEQERVTPTWDTDTQDVGAGAALLDDLVPDWYNTVDLETLNMYDPQLCVLGQVFGHYNDGNEALGLNGGGSISHGFVSPTVLWRREIQKRRAA